MLQRSVLQCYKKGIYKAASVARRRRCVAGQGKESRAVEGRESRAGQGSSGRAGFARMKGDSAFWHPPLHSRHQLGRSSHSFDPWEIALLIGHSLPTLQLGTSREDLDNLGATNVLESNWYHPLISEKSVKFINTSSHYILQHIHQYLLVPALFKIKYISSVIYGIFFIPSEKGSDSFIGFGSFVWFLAYPAFFCFASFVPLVHLLPSSISFFTQCWSAMKED